MGAATIVGEHSRVKKVVVFLGVVWSISALFLILEKFETDVSWFGSTKWGRVAQLSLPQQSGAAVAHCQEVLKSVTPAPKDANEFRLARYLAWRLGYLVGTGDAAVTEGGGDRGDVENVLRQSQPITSGLGIPPLEIPLSGRSVYALHDFTVYLEQDPSCVAAGLRLRYSPEHAASYKFGASVGFAAVFRGIAPQLNDVLVPQLQVYGAAAGVPSDVYSPLTAPLGVSSSSKQEQAIQSVVERIDAYMKAR